VFFSSGNVGAVASNILDCSFSQNSAYSGWGGAFFGTDSLGAMYVTRSSFDGNNAYSRWGSRAFVFD
jgi:predicted outer membrane repeat protein